MLHRIAGLGRQLLNDREERRKQGEFPAITLLLILLLVLLGILLLWFKWPSNSTPILCSHSVVNSKPSPSATATDAPFVLSAYDLWLSMGNTGDEQDFLDALVGKPGKNGFVGSNGLTGADGKSGADGVPGLSAYQLWLNDGHTGSSQEFLDSLTGAAGVNGLSAYELWLAQGNTGTTEDFFNSLAGVPGATGSKGNKGDRGLSAYEIWLKNGNTGTESDFLVSLVGHDGVDGAPGVCSVGDAGSSGAPGAPGAPGLSAYEIWLQNGHVGSEEVFLASLVGPTGAPGPTGATGDAGPPGIGGLGYSGSFWDDTIQGNDGLVSTNINTAYPIYFSEADTANNSGVSVVRCAGDEDRPTGYPAVPKSCITFTHPGVYNIAFSAQLYRTAGGSEDIYSFWLRSGGANVPDTNTDITLISNGQKQVAAWNFFVPVTCNGSCSNYQLMWSYTGLHSNLWYQGPQSSPARPAIPSIIMTVNQVR